MPPPSARPEPGEPRRSPAPSPSSGDDAPSFRSFPSSPRKRRIEGTPTIEGPRARRILLVALAFVFASLYDRIRHTGDILLESLQQQQQQQSARGSAPGSEFRTKPTVPRLDYIRPPGDKEELLDIFEELKEISSPRLLNLPRTPRDIALKYGIPETSRDVECSDNRTATIGWIPNARNATEISRQGKIPRLIFQSWKTNRLKGELCRLVLDWSAMNPEYDYFLFDDASADDFIRLEYGREIFSSYACVKVGAAKCDVWRLLVVYLFGGAYFDADVRPRVPFREWGWGERDVVTARSCTAARRKHPGGCAHQWGLVYAPHHPVLYAAIRATLENLAERMATDVYGVSFWTYYFAWRDGPYNRSYMPGWREEMGGRVSFQDDGAKGAMVKDNGHWQKAKEIWHPECL